MTRAAFLAIALAVASLATPSSSVAAPAASDGKHTGPPLSCEVGPISKTYGGTPWLLYSCADGKTLVIVSDKGSPAMPFYFVFVPGSDGGYGLTGEGTGAKAATDAAFRDLGKLDAGDITGLIAGTQAIGSPAAMIVDLLFGECLSEVSHTELPAGYTDPRAVGRPLTSPPRDSRLSPQAARIPTATGEVYFDHHDKACEVFASGIDAADAVTKVQQALARWPLSRNLPQMPSTAGGPAGRTLSYAIGTLAQDPIPEFTMSYPEGRATTLTAKVLLARQINVTTDSAPGWSPSDDQEKQVVSGTNAFLSAMDAGHYAEAYAWLADINKQQQTLAEFTDATRQFNAKAGPVKERTIVQITWTKDPAQGAPFPGVYAAVDLRSRFANIDRHCGYIVLYQPPAGGGFVVMRREDNFLDNATAESSSPADVDREWAELSLHCPNYPAPPPPPLPEAPPEASGSTIGYPNVTSALEALHAKPGVVFSSNGGWTIAEDEADKTLWSFPPAGDPAYPAAVKR